MGCTISKKELVGLATGVGHTKNDAVSLCSQRKRLLKSAVGRRKIFADAHCKYIRSLYSVSSAIGLFVSTFPPPELRLLQSTSSPADRITFENREEGLATAAVGSSGTWSVNSESSEGENDDEGGGAAVCEFFYGDHSQFGNDNNNNDCGTAPTPPPPPMPSPKSGFGWDFFSLLDDPTTTTTLVDVTVNVNDGEGLQSDNKEETKFKRKTEKNMDVRKGNNHDSHEESKRESTAGMELLTALKDLEKHFVMACESGLDVSRMLEVNTPHHFLPTVMEESEPTQENQSSKYNTTTMPLTPLAWIINRSPSSQSSSNKSFISSSSFKTSTSSNTKTDLFDYGCGIMESGTHSFTLGRLYAWEKKLYQQVKAGEQARNRYQQKCKQLRRRQGQGHSSSRTETHNNTSFKTSSHHNELAELYNKILVVSKSTETISKQIDRMRDEELHPQLTELLHGLTRTWKSMLESHKNQTRIISKVKTFTFTTTTTSTSTSSQRNATQHLESELRNWLTSFTDYITAQKSYINCLNTYLSKLINPPPQQLLHTTSPPPLVSACQTWSTSLKTLPDKPVKFAMKRLVNDTRAISVQIGEEDEMKMRVQSLTKEVERRPTVGVESSRGYGVMNPRRGWKMMSRNRDVCVVVEAMKDKLDLEREKHKLSVERTKAVILNGITIGFSSVFESLVEFSKEMVKMYDEIVGLCDK